MDKHVPTRSVIHVEDPDIGNLRIEIDHKNSNDKNKYPATHHARQVRDILRGTGARDGIIYLAGRPSHLYWEDSDQPPPFRQRRYFYYLSGVDFEDCYVLYNMKEDHLTLFIPRNDAYKVVWNGATPSIEECQNKYDADCITYNDQLVTQLLCHLRGEGDMPVYVLHNDQKPQISDLVGRLGDSMVTSIYEKKLSLHIESTRLQPAMDASRVIKSDYEIELIRKANKISGVAHTHVLRAIKGMRNESEVEAVFGAACVSRFAKTQAYGIIAASGENASVLHYIANDQALKGRQLLCIDAGCEWKCYASDVTRTFPISGTLTKEAQHIYDIVEEMQEECIKRMTKGTMFHDLQVLAHDIALRGLMKLGVLHNGSEDEIRESGVTVVFFPHGLGHHLGLEVHDVTGPRRLAAAPGSYTMPPPETERQELLPNMVITVEPGIYFSRYAIEKVHLKNPRFNKYINVPLLETYYPVGGVRIEDDILVTDDGYENLTSAPKGKAALKIINRGIEEGQL